MRSFSCQLGFGADNVRTRKPVYTTGFRFLGTAKPTLPELTPETKGIAEGDRHSTVREHRNGDRGAGMGRETRRAQIRPLPGASPGVQDKQSGTRRDGRAWLREPLQPHQQSSEQHNHLALIRSTAAKAAEFGVFRIWVFRASAQPPGRFATVGAGLQSAKSCRGWHRPSGLAKCWWTKLQLCRNSFPFESTT